MIAIIHRKNHQTIHSLFDSIRYFTAIHSPSSGMLDGGVVQIIQTSFLQLFAVREFRSGPKKGASWSTGV